MVDLNYLLMIFQYFFIYLQNNRNQPAIGLKQTSKTRVSHNLIFLYYALKHEFIEILLMMMMRIP